MILFDVDFKKTVAYVGFYQIGSKEFTCIGTCFFLGPDPADNGEFTHKVYAVTAAHVLRTIEACEVDEIYIRLNPKDQTAPLKFVNVTCWHISTDSQTDIAVAEFDIPSDADHLVIPYSMCDTPELKNMHWSVPGAEVFVIGLFHHHPGILRNSPIVRVATIATMEGEPINTDERSLNGFLLEVRSSSGLSGSPILYSASQSPNRHFLPEQKVSLILLGLIQGHFAIRVGKEIREDINAGIAVGLPIRDVHATILELENRRTPQQRHLRQQTLP